jgi:hypothetical protein
MLKASVPTKISTDLVVKTQKHIKYPREIVPLSPDNLTGSRFLPWRISLLSRSALLQFNSLNVVISKLHCCYGVTVKSETTLLHLVQVKSLQPCAFLMHNSDGIVP